MGYVFEYPVDQRIVARATSAAYGAGAAEEQLRYAEQKSRADDQLEFQYDQQALDAIQRQQALDDNAYQFNAQLGQQAMQQQAATQLGWANVGINQQQVDQGYAQLDLQQQNAELDFAGQQARANATLTAKEMQIVAAKAQAARQENFERAMFLDKNIELQARKGFFKNQAQYDQAKADVFRQTGIESGAIQREYMNQEITMEREKRQAAMDSYAALTGLSPQELDAMVVDNGNGEYVLADPDFVGKMSTNKADNKRMLAIAEQTNAIKAQTARAEKIDTYANLKRESESKIRIRYAALLAKEADARSVKKDTGAGIAEKKVRPDELPADVKNRLLQQAISEYPLPPPPPEQ